MENTPPADAASVAGLGPRPASPRDAAQPMSRARAQLWERLRSRPGGTTLAALASATGLHANTVREHLDALVRQGLVRRRRSEPTGRGRPAWLYEADDGQAAARPAEYAGLATALAATIHRVSSSPRADAIRAGTDWGHELARDRSSHAGPGEAVAQRRAVDLLEDLGFAPETDDQRSDVRLTRCPLLEAAHRYTDIVCGVHLGIVRGALAEYGARSIDADLLPFAEPGACVLRLTPPPESATR